MDTTTTRNLRECIDREAVDRNGKKIGKVYDIYVDEETRQPEWLAITSGLFGRRVSFVPIRMVSFEGEGLFIDDDADHVKDAPSVDADGHLSPEEEDRLYSHYDMGHSDRRSDTVLPDSTAGRDTSSTAGTANAAATTGRTDIDSDRDETDAAMTRSEEQLDVQKEQRSYGKARLNKWVETEHQQFTVPVRREKAKVVTEPITDENRDRAMAGPDMRENEHEVVLNEEDVVVNKEAVPKERVRLETETETEEKPVEADVRKEHIEMENPDKASNR